MKISKFKIDPHEFRHSIIVQRKKHCGTDEEGLPIEDVWEDYIKTHSKIINSSSKEILLSEEIRTDITKTFYIRGRRDKEITEEDRIIYRGKVYEICCPPNDILDIGEYIEIKAKIIK